MIVFRLVLCYALVLFQNVWAADTLILDDRRDGTRRPLSARWEVLEDPSRSLTVADVTSPAVSQRFQARHQQGQINFGYTRSAYWLRLRLDSAAPANWLLEIAYPTLDRVDAFLLPDQGAPLAQHSGDRLAHRERPYPHRNLVFPLPLPRGEATLLLRVESEGSMTVPATLWQPEALHHSDQRSYTLLALYYGTLLALAGYNLLLYLSLRDRAYLEYVLFALGIAIGIGSTQGMAQQFVWPHSPVWGNAAFPIGFGVAGLFGAMFIRSFLNTRTTTPMLDRVIRALLLVFVVSIAINPWSYQLSSKVVSLGGLLVSLAGIAAGVLAWRGGHKGARFFLLAWTLLLSGIAITALRNFGWLPTNLFTTYSMQIGSTLDLLLLSFALADRIHEARRDKELAQSEALEAKQHLLDTLRRSEQQLEAKVEERTRALEETNARLLASEATLRQLARRDPLTALGNRTLLEEEMHRALRRADRSQNLLALLLVDLDRFKPINDTLGHAVGDEVLMAVARRLEDSLRATDMVFRLGGDEFVVVLEEVGAESDIQQVTEKLIRHLEQPIHHAETSLQIGASIGIARYPADGMNLRELLISADRAMYRAKAEGGGRYCVYGNSPSPTG